jgi:hypothetical protein
LFWETWTETGTLRQGINTLLFQHRLSRLGSKGWAPRTKVSHLMYPCKQVTEAIKLKKTRFNPYIFTCSSIDYFTLVLSALLTSRATWRPSSHLDSLGFISLLCHPLPPATLSEHRLATLSPLGCSDLLRVILIQGFVFS